MLLTSSQVSVALSSGIVIFFTAALFLSGYAIQQRTLRDLRAAIKPKPSPKIIIQEQFRKSKDVPGPGAGVGSSAKPEIVVEVRPTLPGGVADTSDGTQTQVELGERERDPGVGGKQPKKQRQQQASGEDAEPEKAEKPISRAERRRRIKEEIMKLAEGQERGYYQRRLW